MDLSSENKLFSKKNIIAYLLLAILALAIPLGVRLVETQTEQLQIQAAGGDLRFPKTETQECRGDECTTTSEVIKVEIKAPEDFK